jgi:putative autoinducer-2 (AI-2) aldolase
MGRNIFQSDAPGAMISAVRMVVHDNATVNEAFEYYQDIKNK